MSTARDKAILNSILNPFLPVGGDFDTEDPLSQKDVIGEITDDVLEAKRIEKEAIAMAENGKVLEAIEALSEAIKLAPQLPSLYNNRAQAHRLNGDVEGAFLDLNTAITISKGSGRSACQAFCQRGLIYKKNNEGEKAMEDFKRAAQLGSPFAKMILVQSNPYAALCNEMLSQVMDKLAKGHWLTHRETSKETELLKMVRELTSMKDNSLKQRLKDLTGSVRDCSVQRIDGRPTKRIFDQSRFYFFPEDSPVPTFSLLNQIYHK